MSEQELQQKVDELLKGTAWGEQVKTTLQVAYEMSKGFNSLDKFYRENLASLKESNEKINQIYDEFVNQKAEFEANYQQMLTTLDEKLKGVDEKLTNIDELKEQVKTFNDKLNENKAEFEKMKETQQKVEEALERQKEIENKIPTLKEEVKTEMSEEVKNKVDEGIAEIAKSINTGLQTLGKKIFSIQIDFSKIGKKGVEPAEYLKATDEAKGATLAQIQEWLGSYPCVLNPTGTEMKKLKKDDYAKFEDDSDASGTIITAGNDVMLCRVLRGYRLRRLGTSIGELSFTDDEKAVGFNFEAFRDTKGVLKAKYYEGVYKGYVSGGKLYSTSGQSPAANATIGTFRSYAQARGEGYNLVNYEQLKFRQAAYLLAHQDLNSQRKIGRGWADGNSASTKTGGTNAYGFNSELIKTSNPTHLTDGKHQIKCDGLEDFWGNVWEFIDGFKNNAGQILISTGNFNDTGLGYTNIGYGINIGDLINQNIASVFWDNDFGFYPAQVGGEVDAYFCDGYWHKNNTILLAGGNWDVGATCGVFCLTANETSSSAAAYFGARLVKM